MNFFSTRKQKELDELDAFITNQEFEPCHIEDNVFEDPKFWQSLGPLSRSKANIKSDEELFALALVLNMIKDFRKNEFIPNYETLFFILKKILIKQPALSHEGSCSELKLQTGDSKFVVSRLRMDFQMCERLGKGGCGVVVRAKSNLDSKEYAIKKINIYPNTNRDRMLREVRILSCLLHPNVVRYHGGWLDYVTEEVGEDPGSGEIDECEEATRVTTGNEDTCETSKEDKTFVSSGGNLDGVGIFMPVLPINNPKLGSTIAVRSSNNASLDLLRRGNIVSTFTNIIITQSQLITKQKSKSQNEIIPTESKSCFHSSDNRTISKRPLDHPELFPVLCIQLELCEGNLKEWLVKRNARRNTFYDLSPLDFEIANDFSIQLFEGLSYIHSKDIIHRDIKPSNLMLSEYFQVLKIGDFGLSKETYDETNIDSSNTNCPNSQEHTIRIGTPPYSSPEQYTSNDYTNKTDIFSSALVMLELFSPFRDLDERMDNLENLREGYLSDDFKQFYPFESNMILSMVDRDWDNRPSADRILELFSVRNGQNETYLNRTITMKEALLKLKDEKIAELEAKIKNMETK